VLKTSPANVPPTQSKNTAFLWFFSSFLSSLISSVLNKELNPAFLSSSSYFYDRLMPSTLTLDFCLLRHRMIILLVFEVAALSTTVSAYSASMISIMPRTDRGLTMHMLISC
jgi:hypothetical protein